MEILEYFNTLDTAQQVQLITPIFAAFFGAIFAYIFFMLGEDWKTKKAERLKKKRYLITMKELLLWHIYYIETTKANHNSAKTKSAIGVDISKLEAFPILNEILLEVGEHQLAETTIRYMVHIRLLNEQIGSINEYRRELNYLYKEAILTDRIQKFEQTLADHKTTVLELIDSNLETLETVSEKVRNLLAEVEWTRQFNEVNPLTWCYIVARLILNKNYRTACIDKIRKNTSQKDLYRSV